MIFELLVGEIVERLKDQGLEHQYHVVALCADIGLSGFVADGFEGGTKRVSVNHGIEGKERVRIVVNAVETNLQIE